MAIDLITEAEARRQWAGEMLVVRMYRDLKADFSIYGCFALAALLVTYPLWRPELPGLKDIPYWLAFLFATGLGFFAYWMMQDLRAARHGSSWLLAASRERVWVHFRSFHHYKWPATDPTVFVIDKADVQSFYAVRISGGRPPQMAIRLAGAIPPELVDVLMDKNPRLHGEGMVRGRPRHEPVRLEQNGATLRLMFDAVIPEISLALDKLRFNYKVEPQHTVPDAEAYLLPNQMELTDAMIDIAIAMVKEGQEIEAIRYLRQRTGMSLKDCKGIVGDMARHELPPQS